MKVPLEPIPTEQIVLAKEKPPLSGAHAHATVTTLPGAQAGDGGGARDSGQMEKAYPWLLGVSTCLSALLCWMYVTKPVIIQDSGAAQQVAVVPDVTPAADADEGLTTVIASTGQEPEAELVPSDSRLPGASTKPVASTAVAGVSAADETAPAVNLGATSAHLSGQGPGWEKTNLKVQHILSADDGSGELEKIVLNVPVIYQTRNMRWSPAQVSEARGILSRLMMYERNLSNLRKEGTSIMEDWNRLIKNTVPASVLRADSPSLPYNHTSDGGKPLQSGDSSLIQVENR